MKYVIYIQTAYVAANSPHEFSYHFLYLNFVG